MASSGSTSGFALNQWEASDHVLREDFNSDNQKIDAALSAKGVVLLGSITAGADCSQLDVDVSDIDWDACSSVYIDYCLKSAVAGTFILRANSLSTSNSQALGADNLISSYGLGRLASNAAATPFGTSRVAIFSRFDKESYLTVQCSPCLGMPSWGYQPTRLKDLTSINAIPTDSEVTFLAGSTVKVWGVK